jgi:hypothetical protein
MFSYAPGNKLSGLRPEIEYDNFFLHNGGIDTIWGAKV